MSEQESNQKQLDKFNSENSEILTKLDKLSAIAIEQKKVTPSDKEAFEKEEDAFEGKSEASSFMEQLGKKDDEKESLKHQNENLRLQNENLRLKNELLKHKNKVEKILDSERTDYTKKLFRLTISWLIIVVLFVLFTGLRYYKLNNSDCVVNCVNFNLSDNVLIAFITSTTATVIGIFIIVAKWLFPPPHNKEDSEDKKK